MNDAKGWEALAEFWGRVTDAVRHHDVIDGEVLASHYHDMSVKELD